MADKKVRLLCAGGGTGGHIFPMISLLDYIDQHHADYIAIDAIYRVGQSHGLEKKVLDQHSFSNIAVGFLSVPSGKLRRQKTAKAFFQNILDIIKLGRGALKAIFYCQRHRINVIFSKGGYVALPILIAAKLLKISTIIHESDTKFGMTNRFASNFAQHIYSSYPGVHPDAVQVTQLLTDKMTKVPVKSDFLALTGQEVDSLSTYVIVTGGSQGAKSLYQGLASSLNSNPDIYKDMIFIIIGGVLNDDVSVYFDGQPNCIFLPFLNQEDMATLYFYGDIAITRGGSTSLAEQKLHNMLLCIVPLPRTHDQKKNAEHYIKNYGDIMILQNDELSSSLDKTFSVLQGYKKAQARDDQLKDQLPKTKKTIADAIISLD